MSLFASPRFLRRVLWADAASCLGCGALQLAWPGLDDLLALPGALLTASGVFLLAYAGLVAWLARRDPLPRLPVRLLVTGNLGWALACVVLLASGAVQPGALGTAYIVLQAVTVTVLAELQWFGLRAQPRPAVAW